MTDTSLQGRNNEQEALEQHVELLKQQVADLEQYNLELSKELEYVYASRSWKVTAPLRLMLHYKSLKKGHREIDTTGRPDLVGGVSYRLGKGLHYLANIGWCRRIALLTLNRLPRVKHRLQRLLALMPAEGSAWISSGGHDEDYQDLVSFERGNGRQRELELRDQCMPRDLWVHDICALRVEGHFNGSYSLASTNRQLVLQLQRVVPNYPLVIAPRESERTSNIAGVPEGESRAAELRALVERGNHHSEPLGIALYHHFPLIKSLNPSSGLPIALFFWEESRIPEEIIQTLNSNYAGVVVTTWFVKKTLLDNGCLCPIQLITPPMLQPLHSQDASVNDLERVAVKGEVSLLHISSGFPRKGLDILLQAFNELAARMQNVKLTIKSFPNPHNYIEMLVDQCLSDNARDRLNLIMDDYDQEKMAALYLNADIIVLPTRGEGLNMPALEAGAYGRLLLVTGYGAHTDYAWHDNSWWIPYRFDFARSHLSEVGSVWVDPGITQLTNQLENLSRALLDGSTEHIQHAQNLKHHVDQKVFSDHSVDIMMTGIWRLQQYHQYRCGVEANNIQSNATSALDLVKSTPGIKLTMLSTWHEACGIAEYSKYLLTAMKDQLDAVEVIAPQGRVDKANADLFMDTSGIRYRESWLKGQAPDLRWLKLDSDVLWLQHHFAFYGLDRRLARGVQYWQEQSVQCHITLHTTRPLLSFEKSRQHQATSCLALFDRVFVHTIDDLNTLKRIGVVDNVSLMSQGVLLQPLHRSSATKSSASVASNSTAKALPVTVGSFGFLLPHKGIDLLIEAFAKALKNRSLHKDSRLCLVTAVLDNSTSPHELKRCQHLAERLGVDDRIDWHTDFIPLEDVTLLLGQCDFVMLPYQLTRESSSAAVRTAIAACPIVATTPAPIFDEVRSLTYPIAGFSVSEIEKALMALAHGLVDEERHSLSQAREEWLFSRRWDVIAHRYVNLMSALKVDRDMLRFSL